MGLSCAKVLWAAVAGLLLWEAAVYAQTATEPVPQVQIAAPAADASSLGGLSWRNVGPFRGGRVTTVAGVPQDEHMFYMGATGGGVWKTTDAGISWKNVSDGYFQTGSVGAIAVAPSNPDIIYVGMGEHCVRIETFASGDGVYKSIDGGKSWTHVGLETTRQIASVVIDPVNPDIVYVAAQGSPWGPQDDRGIYKSVDGGASWKRVLAGTSDTGASDLVMDPKDPTILYAAMWQHRQKPWHGYQITSGGPNSALYKSIDAGRSWSKLRGGGLPPSIGRATVAVSGADSKRLYALVEAKPDEGGLFRSDDAGVSWTLVNDTHIMSQRSGYYMHIVADPLKLDTVYVLHAPLLKSTDGGKTFAPLRPPHGDNHAMWINPKDSDWLIDGNDGGAHISYNGGKTWSSELNQPTAQFYRVIADNLFPYNLYGGQQDNSTVKTKSRSFSDGIGIRDWYDIGRGESAHVAFDPDHPVLVYAGNYQGQIGEYDDRTAVLRNVQRYPLPTAYRPGELYHFRFNWNAPILLSHHDRKTLYHGSQFVLKSSDRGQHWTEISPDLTRNDPRKHGFVAGEFTTDGIAGSMYNTIYYIAESATRQGELWVGTDDGRVHLTRNEGKSWTEITPNGLGETLINMIELSPHQAGKAYIVTTAYRFNDFTPNILVTEDYGRTWTRKVTGIKSEDFVRVVREDPVRKGLLFAGSEKSVYMSFDDGNHWRPLQLNLPHVPVTDLRVHGNDLVASTQGRAFWVLDDIAPLRDVDRVAAGSAHLYPPTALPLIRTGRSREAGQGENPPSGALIYFSLPAGRKAETLKLEILDAEGRLINSYAAGAAKAGAALPSAAGLNRFVWDWEIAPIARYPEIRPWRGSRAYRVAPGRYQARLTAGQSTLTQPFDVLPDPRVVTTPQANADKQALLAALRLETVALLDAVGELKATRANVQATLADADVARNARARRAGAALDAAIDTWLNLTIEANDKHFIDVSHSSERLDFNLLSALVMVDSMEAPITAGLAERVADVRGEWTKRRAEFAAIAADVTGFKALAGHWVVAPPPKPEDDDQSRDDGGDDQVVEENDDEDE